VCVCVPHVCVCVPHVCVCVCRMCVCVCVCVCVCRWPSVGVCVHVHLSPSLQECLRLHSHASSSLSMAHQGSQSGTWLFNGRPLLRDLWLKGPRIDMPPRLGRPARPRSCSPVRPATRRGITQDVEPAPGGLPSNVEPAPGGLPGKPPTAARGNRERSSSSNGSVGSCCGEAHSANSPTGSVQSASRAGPTSRVSGTGNYTSLPLSPSGSVSSLPGTNQHCSPMSPPVSHSDSSLSEDVFWQAEDIDSTLQEPGGIDESAPLPSRCDVHKKQSAHIIVRDNGKCMASLRPHTLLARLIFAPGVAANRVQPLQQSGPVKMLPEKTLHQVQAELAARALSAKLACANRDDHRFVHGSQPPAVQCIVTFKHVCSWVCI